MPTKAKKKRSTLGGYVFFLAIFFISAAILAYPSVASWWNAHHQVKEVEGYQVVTGSLSEQDYTDEWQKAKDYNEALKRTGTILTDPFDFEAAKKAADSDVGNYRQILNFDSVMATIEIPEIDVNLPIYHGTDEATLELGIGHLEGTALPIGGEGNHSVLTGHTGLPGKTLFTNLIKLEEGDIFLIHVMNETLTYQVDQIAVILPDDISLLATEEGRDLITLVTCTPYGVNDHRLLVRGTRIFLEQMPEEEKVIIEEKIHEDKELTQIQKIELGAAAVAFVLFIIMLYLTVSSAVREKKALKKHES